MGEMRAAMCLREVQVTQKVDMTIARSNVMRVAARRWLNRSACAVGVVGVLLLLSGCTPAAKIYARLHGQDIRVAVCEPIDATEIRVTADGPNDGDGGRLVWEAKGGSRLVIGQIVDIGTAPVGMSGGEIKTIDLATEDISVSITGSVDGDTRVKKAIFTAGTLSSKHWRAETSDAGTAASPCS
jgi:hypothetical protein